MRMLLRVKSLTVPAEPCKLLEFYFKAFKETIQMTLKFSALKLFKFKDQGHQITTTVWRSKCFLEISIA